METLSITWWLIASTTYAWRLSRRLEDLTVGPVLTWTTEELENHIKSCLKVPGAELLFGGERLAAHNIPSCYGAIQPTAVSVSIDSLLSEWDICTKEVFGPFQIIVEYSDGDLEKVLAACERMTAHLTAAVVSNDLAFQNRVLGSTVNGTTYCGMRARTTGAPQNHWFGPAGDPRGAGIGTKEAIQLVWSCHREVIHDALVPDGWQLPDAS